MTITTSFNIKKSFVLVQVVFGCKTDKLPHVPCAGSKKWVTYVPRLIGHKIFAYQLDTWWYGIVALFRKKANDFKTSAPPYQALLSVNTESWISTLLPLPKNKSELKSAGVLIEKKTDHVLLN